MQYKMNKMELLHFNLKWKKKKKRYIKSIHDPYSKERWIELRNCLQSEFQIIKDISMELGSFKFSSKKNVILNFIICLYKLK